MSTMRPLHLPWSPLLATAVVLWVVGEPLLARKSSIFTPAAITSPMAGDEAAAEAKRPRAGQAARLSNFTFGHPVTL